MKKQKKNTDLLIKDFLLTEKINTTTPGSVTFNHHEY